MQDVTIVVATFGDPSWIDTAERVALPSADATGCPVVHCHSGSMYAARNACLSKVDTEWIINLDADDELEPGYIDAMLASTGDVRVPRARYITDPTGPDPAPIMPKVVWPPRLHARHATCSGPCLTTGNWVVIGAMARTGLLRAVGGWRDYALEDWDMWLRCHLAGAQFQATPDAIYRAHGRLSGRGLGSDYHAMLTAHRAVAAANGVPSP